MNKSHAQYLHALEVAWEKFLMLEPTEVAKSAEVKFDTTKNEFAVPFLNELYYVRVKSREVVASDNKPSDILLSLLILKIPHQCKAHTTS